MINKILIMKQMTNKQKNEQINTKNKTNTKIKKQLIFITFIFY